MCVVFFNVLMCGHEPWDLSSWPGIRSAPCTGGASPDHPTTGKPQFFFPPWMYTCSCDLLSSTVFWALRCAERLNSHHPRECWWHSFVNFAAPLFRGGNWSSEGQPSSFNDTLKPGQRVKIRLFASWTWVRAPITVAQHFFLSWWLSWSGIPSPVPFVDSGGTRDRCLPHSFLISKNYFTLKIHKEWKQKHLERKILSTQKHAHGGFNSFIHNHQDLEATDVFFSSWMVKQTMIHPDSGIWPDAKKMSCQTMKRYGEL